MLRLVAHPRFLTVYSAVLTVAFIATVALDFVAHRERPVLGAEQHDLRHPDFDQLTVHRINIVEPDGTPRLVISDKAEFPGGFFKGKELVRPDRADAGMLFMNDEGTENGGMLFGGHKDAQGQFHSSGHLSFDEYEQDQTLSLDTDQDGQDREAGYRVNDNASDTLFTPEVLNAFTAMKALPDGPAKQAARNELLAKYPIKLPQRALLGRLADKSAVLLLRDPEGHIRIRLRVAGDGTPTMEFLDAAGKVAHAWPESSAPAPKP